MEAEVKGYLVVRRDKNTMFFMLELVRERREIPSHAYKDPAGYGKLNFVMIETSCHTNEKASMVLENIARV